MGETSELFNCIINILAIILGIYLVIMITIAFPPFGILILMACGNKHKDRNN